MLCTKYIFPEKAAAAAKVIRTRRDAGDYRDLGDEALAERLTSVLHEVCADKHLSVRLRDAELRAAPSEQEMSALMLEWSRLTNHGITKVERLDGNIGYLALRYVDDPRAGGRAIAAAMKPGSTGRCPSCPASVTSTARSMC